MTKGFKLNESTNKITHAVTATSGTIYSNNSAKRAGTLWISHVKERYADMLKSTKITNLICWLLSRGLTPTPDIK